MKSALAVPVMILLAATAALAETPASPTLGVHALAGGRYDDMRMCVGSPRGVPGGPIGEVYLDLAVPVGDRGALVVNVPLMRPLLFGAAFGMLQFEPQLTYEIRLGDGSGSGGARPVLGAGAGAVFHYGPDVDSTPENRGEDFFAAGPLVSGSFGLEFDRRGGTWRPGVKLFYAPLFASGRSVGTVAGGALEIHYGF